MLEIIRSSLRRLGFEYPSRWCPSFLGLVNVEALMVRCCNALHKRNKVVGSPCESLMVMEVRYGAIKAIFIDGRMVDAGSVRL